MSLRIIHSLSVLVSLMNCGIASAGDRYRTHLNGTWSVASTWEVSADGETWKYPADHPPNASDVAVDLRHTVFLTTNATVNTLTIQALKWLWVERGVTLTFAGAGAGAKIEGFVELASDGSALNFAASANIGGSGYIEGNNNSASILITPAGNDNISLTSCLTISGQLYIGRGVTSGTGVAMFINRGVVDADASIPGSLIQIGGNSSYVSVSDSPGDRWKVSNAFSALLFVSGPPSTLAGNFRVQAGILGIINNVGTSGCVELSSGGASISVGGGAVFQGAACSGTCPPSIIYGPAGVSCP